MRGRVVARECLVERQDGPAVEVRVLAQGEAERVHVPVQGLEPRLETRKERVERGRGPREIIPHEVLEGRLVAVGVAPKRGRLLEPALQPRPLGFAVLGQELGFELRRPRREPRRRGLRHGRRRRRRGADRVRG